MPNMPEILRFGSSRRRLEAALQQTHQLNERLMQDQLQQDERRRREQERQREEQEAHRAQMEEMQRLLAKERMDRAHEELQRQEKERRAKEEAQHRREQEIKRKEERIARMRLISPESLRDLRELMRTKYDLDLEIWQLRGVRKPDRWIVQEKMEKADVVLGDIFKIVGAWEGTQQSWTRQEWKLVEEIRERVFAEGTRWWVGSPPWEEDQDR